MTPFLLRLSIADAHRGVGKTPHTGRVCAGLRGRGLTAHPFEVGPARIDSGDERLSIPERRLGLTPTAKTDCWQAISATVSLACGEVRVSGNLLASFIHPHWHAVVQSAARSAVACREGATHTT